MTNKKEIIQNVRLDWIYSMFEFAHIEYQERLWINAEYSNSIGDFTEAICKYFNDLNLEEGYCRFIKEGFISKKEYEIVAEFHQKLNDYLNRPEKKNLSDKNVLKDIEWIGLCNIAFKNWSKLKTEIENPAELDYMDELENNFLR